MMAYDGMVLRGNESLFGAFVCTWFNADFNVNSKATRISFFSGNLPDMRLKSCNFTEKTEINTSRLFLGSFVHMVSHGPIVDCDL